MDYTGFMFGYDIRKQKFDKNVGKKLGLGHSQISFKICLKLPIFKHYIETLSIFIMKQIMHSISRSYV